MDLTAISNMPLDIKAESLINYLGCGLSAVHLKGTHKRNAYIDILAISSEDDQPVVDVAKKGLYDLLPETLFHPIDRFENIAANEYKERFQEEIERQHAEEENARGYFEPYDRVLFGLSCVVDNIKSGHYAGHDVLVDVISDSMSDLWKQNRFIRRMMPYLPMCRNLRGNMQMLSLILRKILSDEGLALQVFNRERKYTDAEPRYKCCLNPVELNQINADREESMREESEFDGDFYLGNEYSETVVEYEVKYWNDDECNDSFLDFVEEMCQLQDFINDYFIGIESQLKFVISTEALPVRISDEMCHTFMGYNTNL